MATNPKTASKSRQQDRLEDRAREPAHASREQEQHSAVDMSAWDDFQPDFGKQYLKAPMPRPGMDQRWIRVANAQGKDDVINVQRQHGKGWRPRPSATIPSTFGTPTEAHGKFPGALVVEGMVLCERPQRISQLYREANREEIDRLTAAIDAELRNAATAGQSAYGPIERQAKTRFLRERVPVAADEAA